MTAVIIDDEVYCSDVINILLTKHCPEVRIEAIFNDVLLAKEYLIKNQPDIIFLDIEMPRLNGFDLLLQLGNISSRIVFTTAYDQYAIKAIKLNVLDYLLKPIDRNELMETIEKIKTIRSVKKDKQDNTNQELRKSKFVNKIALRNNDGISFISLDNIIFIEGDSAYSIFHMVNQKKIVISKTLSFVEELLDEPFFFRVHKSYIANLKYVENYIRGDGGEIIMSNGMSISLSRNKKEQFLKIFGQGH
jgi:two-component system LytT family response regulator